MHDDESNVTLTVDGNEYVFEVYNSAANAELSKLDGGNRQYRISYSGDAKYFGFANNDSMKVNNTAVKHDNNMGGINSKDNTIVVIGLKINVSNLTVIYVAGKYCSVTVYGANVKIVKNTKRDIQG